MSKLYLVHPSRLFNGTIWKYSHLGIGQRFFSALYVFYVLFDLWSSDIYSQQKSF